MNSARLQAAKGLLTEHIAHNYTYRVYSTHCRIQNLCYLSFDTSEERLRCKFPLPLLVFIEILADFFDTQMCHSVIITPCSCLNVFTVRYLLRKKWQ